MPQCAEVALLGLAVAVSVNAAVVNSVGRVAVKLGAAHPEALGGADHPGAAFAGSGSVGNAHESVGS